LFAVIYGQAVVILGKVHISHGGNFFGGEKWLLKK
jgi:hypothetical protein